MKFLCLFSILMFTAIRSFSQTSVDMHCEFPDRSAGISINNFKSGFQDGETGRIELNLTENGHSSLLQSVSPVSMGRSSWVENDLKDDRPAAILDFESGASLQRLAVFYCSGDGSKVEAKLFSGSIVKSNNSSFVSTSKAMGHCVGKNLTQVLTNDCKSFR